MNLKNKIIEKLIAYGKNHPRLSYPIIGIIAFVLTVYHGGRKYLYDRRYHPIRQRITAFVMIFTIVFTTTGILNVIAENGLLPGGGQAEMAADGNVLNDADGMGAGAAEEEGQPDGGLEENPDGQEPEEQDPTGQNLEEQDPAGQDAEEQDPDGQDTEEQNSDAENTGEEDGETEIKVIRSFAYPEEDTLFVPYETEESQIPFPDELQAELQTGEYIAVPVFWECIDDGYGGASYDPLYEDMYTVFTFEARWDETEYILSEEADTEVEVPLIYVLFECSNMELLGFPMMMAAAQETLTLEPSYKTGNPGTDFKISDTNNFDITVSMTAGMIEEPILKLTIPKGITVSYYPDASNATLSTQIAAGKTVTKTTDAGGNTVLTYPFKKNIAQVGFNITLLPTYKLKDGMTYQITADYYDGDTLLTTEQTGVTVNNSTVQANAITPSSSTKTVTLDGSADYYVVLSPTLYVSSYSSHYDYDSVTLTVPLPTGVVPGFGKDASFTAMTNNTTYQLNNGNIEMTYLENYNCKNSAGTVNKTSNVLKYKIKGSHSFCTSSYYITINEDIYLKYSNITSAGTYTPGIGTQISIQYDGIDKVVYDFAVTTSAYYNFANCTFADPIPFNLDDHFKLSQTGVPTYGYYYSNYVYPLDQKIYSYFSLLNNTDAPMTDVVMEYVIPEQLYAQRVTFTLSSAATSKTPSQAVISYKTKKGGDTLYNKTMTIDEPELVLTDTTDAITYIRAAYDIFRISTSSTRFMSIYYSNWDNLNETTARAVTGQILSAESEAYGSISARAKNSLSLYLKNTYSASCSVTASATVLNKGDEFYLSELFSDDYSTILLKNQISYCLMPKGYIFTKYTPPSAAAYTGAAYTVTQRDMGDNILYTVTYTDSIERNSPTSSSASGRFYFKVGPSVDTSQVRDVTLPAGMFYENNHPIFPISKTYVGNEATLDIDINGDGDKSDTFSKPYSYPTIRLNSVNALSAEGYLTSDVQMGESTSKEYRYGSSGVYSLKIYNGFSSGTTASDMEIIIPLPKENSTYTYNGTSYKSTWDVYLTSAIATEGTFLEGASITYSTDDGVSYQSSVSDYGAVTHIKIISAGGKLLESNQSAVADIPFTVGFNERMTSVTTTYKAYFVIQMTYRDSLNNIINTAAVTPSELSSKITEISGTVYKDYNGNGIKDTEDTGGSYSIALYKGSSATGTALRTVTSNSSTGVYSTGVLLPGTYTLKVTKGSADYYPTGNPYFNTSGEYTFTVGTASADILTNVNLGLLSPRTISLNASSFTLIGNGSTRKIVPTLSPALGNGENNVTYISADPSVAEVAADGTVTWKKEGSTTITVTAPQLSAMVAAGANAAVTSTVTVTCQLPGCHITAEPYFAANSTAIVQQPASSANYVYYYYYGRGGYCNDSSHTDSKTAAITILDDGGTGATIGSTTNSTTYGYATLTVRAPGTIVLQSSETWGHNSSDNPGTTTFTLTVTPRTVTVPALTVSPSSPDGDNGWYKTLPQITLTQTQAGTTVSTLFSQNASAYSTLTSSNKPAITEGGTYSFAAYSKENQYNVASATVTLSGIKVDVVSPPITNVTEPANSTWRTLQTISFQANDGGSGLADVQVTLSGQAVVCGKNTETGYYGFTASANGSYVITATDYAGNVTTETVTISKIDTTPPTGVALTGMDAGNAWVNQNVTLTVNAADAESGIKEYCYSLDGGSTFSSLIPWNTSGGNTFTIDTNGDYADCIMVSVYNHAGNYTDSASVTVKLDKQTPALAVTDVNTGTFTNQDIVFTLANGVTNISGVTYYVKKTGDTSWTMLTDGIVSGYGVWNETDSTLTVSEDKNTSYFFRVVSGAGLADEADQGYIVKLQKTIAGAYGSDDVSASGIPNEDGWYDSSLTLTVDKRTAAAGHAVIKTYYKLYLKGASNPATYELTGDMIDVNISGDVVLELWTEDEAGNTTAVYANEYKADCEAPEITEVFENPTIPVNTPVNIVLNIVDTVSGVCADKITIIKDMGTGGEQVIEDYDCESIADGFEISFTTGENGVFTIKAEDAAGNKTIHTITIDQIDMTDPLLISLDRPVNGGTDVLPSAELTFTVNEKAKKGSNVFIRIYDEEDNLVAYLSADNNRVRVSMSGGQSSIAVQFPQQLDYGKTYYVKVDQGFVTDLAGNLLDSFGGAGEWSFTTVSEADAASMRDDNDVKLLGITVEGKDAEFQAVPNAEDERIYEIVVTDAFYSEDGTQMQFKLTPAFDFEPENITAGAITPGVTAVWDEDGYITITVPTDIPLSEILIEIGIDGLNDYVFKIFNSSFRAQLVVSDAVSQQGMSFGTDENVLLNAVNLGSEAEAERQGSQNVVVKIDMLINEAGDWNSINSISALMIGNTGTTLMFFDITINKYIKITENGNVIQEENIPVNTTQSVIPIVIGIPEEMWGRDFTYHIFREHNGEITELPYQLSEDGHSLLVESDLFSTYAVAYTEWVTLEYAAAQGGSIQGKTTQRIQKAGAASQITAVPDDGYTFSGWSDGITAAARNDTGVSSDFRVTANFAVIDAPTGTDNNTDGKNGQNTGRSGSNAADLALEPEDAPPAGINSGLQGTKGITSKETKDAAGAGTKGQDEKEQNEEINTPENDTEAPDAENQGSGTGLPEEENQQKDSGSMAIVSILLVLLSIAAFFYTWIRRSKERWLPATLLLGLQVIIFFLTQSIVPSFVIVDKYTVVYVLFLTAELICAFYQGRQPEETR